jgi:hypothetical protein
MDDLRNRSIFEGVWAVSPILPQIPTLPQREGCESSFQDEQGKIRRFDLKPISASAQFKQTEARGLSLPEFLTHFKKLGGEMGHQMMMSVFGTIDEATKETGNVVRGPLSWNVLLDLLEKLEIDFGPDGKPIQPSLVLGSKAYEEFRRQAPLWEKDPAFRARLESIYQTKWRKFCEREAGRRLVD